MTKIYSRLIRIDNKIIYYLNKAYIPLARLSIFLIFFWFGLIKLLGVSPASPLAIELTTKTVGMEYFDTLFIILAIFECIVGLLFLLPKATRVVIPLLFFHMAIVCSPLLITPKITWQSAFVPTLEGQYIIKNAVVVAVAIGIAASTVPMKKKTDL